MSRTLNAERLPFEVASATSFDEDFPPEELLTQNHNPGAKGWRSERFCTYPQQLILHLAPGNCRIRKLQILSHHFMISSKVELFIGRSIRPRGAAAGGIQDDDGDDDRPHSSRDEHGADEHNDDDTHKGEFGLDGGGALTRRGAAAAGRPKREVVKGRAEGAPERKVEFTRLGYVTLSENAGSGYNARELKSIHLDAEGDFVKVVMRQNYINTYNLYNQVGIVAINVLGEIMDSDYFVKGASANMLKLVGLDPLEPEPEWQPSHENINAALWGAIKQPSVEKSSIPSIRDLAFTIYNDEDIAKLIETVLAAKDAAVKAENFPLAKVLKILYQLAKKAGEEIARLQVLKATAIEREDYEMAEDVKVCQSFTCLFLRY
ncbi:hypothetical protein HK101_010303 [Irineochytrium annulatum]|nr:hypothetical protein HK101_010303 [Irineochytrium annulatum]